MKWLGGIITSLIVLALGTIFVAFLQPIVKAIAPEEALKADAEFSHWREAPKKSGIIEKKPSDDPRLAEIARQVFLYSDFYDFVEMTIDNPTSKIAENIRVKLPPHKIVDGLIVTNSGLRQQSIKSTNDFSIPNMKPGDVTKLYMWGEREFPKVLVDDEIKTYSSLGSIHTKFSFPSDKSYYSERESKFFTFVDRWAYYIFAGTLIMLCIALGFGLEAYSKIVRKILRESQFYQDEKQRFDVDPKKYEPNFTDL